MKENHQLTQPVALLNFETPLTYFKNKRAPKTVFNETVQCGGKLCHMVIDIRYIYIYNILLSDTTN